MRSVTFAIIFRNLDRHHEQPTSAACETSNDKSSVASTVVWTIRAIVAVVALVLLFLAWQEFQVKQAFSSTNEAWQSALRSKGENAELTKSEFSTIPIKGRPTMTSNKAETNSFGAVNVDTSTWKEKLRTYAVRVYFGLGNDPLIDQIEVVTK